MTPAIVGVGRTPFTHRTDVSAAALAVQAISAALADAGLRLEDVDGVVRFDREAAWEYDLPGVHRVRQLGYYGAVPDAAGSGPALLRLAAMAVAQGNARVVVAYHARSEPRPMPTDDALAEVLGAVPARGPGARVGGVALVVCAPDEAVIGRDAAHRLVRILGTMQAAVPSAARHVESWRAARRDGVVRRAASRMFGGAGLDPGAVDVACLYAHPPALVGLVRADLGLDGRASGPRLNPHAGGPDAAALDGVDDVLEAVRQLRGDAASPVSGARVALAAASPLEPTSAVLLGAPP